MKKRMLLFWSIVFLTMCVCAAISVSASSASEDPVIISFRSAEHASSTNGEAYIYTKNPEITGTFEYDAKELALAVKYTEGDHYLTSTTPVLGHHRFALRFTEANQLSADHIYMCIVYKTTSAEDWDLRLRNPTSTGQNDAIYTDEKTSNEWLVTTPSAAIANKSKNAFNRLNNQLHIMLTFETAETDAVFYIKEVAFFTSAEQANEWYADLDGYLAAKDKTEAIPGDTDGNGAITANDMVVLGRTLAKWRDYSWPYDITAFDFNADGRINPLDLVHLARYVDDLSVIVTPETPYLPKDDVPTGLDSYPVTLSFESRERFESNAILYVKSEKPSECGAYEFKDAALTLKYSRADVSWLGKYRVMFSMEAMNWLKEDHRYVKITYRTNAESGELHLHNNADVSNYVLISSDVSESAGEWITTKIAQIPVSMLEQLNAAKPITLVLHSDERNIAFEVKEIVFCSETSEEEFDDIVTSPTDVENVIWNLSSQTNMAGSNAAVYVRGTATHKFGSFAGQNAMQLTYATHNLGNYRVMLNTTNTAQFEASDTWYVRVTYKTDATINAAIKLTNNLDNGQITLGSTVVSTGNEWKITAPVKLPSAFVERLRSGKWLTFGFDFLSAGLNVYIKEVAFFPNVEEACAHYGDVTVDELEAAGLLGAQVSMKLYDELNSYLLGPDAESGLGLWERDEETNAIRIKWIENNTYGWGHYRIMPSFNEVTEDMAECRYVRIVYRAENPHGITEPVALKIFSNAASSVLTVEDNVENTNGEWVISPVQELSDVIHNRWLSTDNNMHCTVSFSAPIDGGEYEIKEILFFKTYEDAAGYRTSDTYVDMSISDTSIDEYVIVVSENAAPRTKTAAQSLKSHIFNISGVTLDIVSDSEKAQDNEILVGNTNRAESQIYYSGKNGKYVAGELTTAQYTASVANGKLVVSAGTEIALEEGVTTLIKTYLIPTSKEFDIADTFNVMGNAKLANYTGTWDDPVPVANPDVFTDDFSDAERTDSYFVEAYATDNWEVDNGVYSTKATDFTYTRLHVYERDIDYTAKIRFNELNENSDAGLLARYNDTNAYIRVGYKNGEWYLRYSEGIEFNVYTVDSASATVEADTWYTVRVVVQKNEVKVYIDGKLTMSTTYISHLSPGPMGMFAENADVSFDDMSVTLVSGQGKVMRGVVDSTFPAQENYLSSGSVIEMADGTLRYVHSDESQHRVSHDGGLTWEKEVFTDVTTDCVNIFRLASRKLIKLMEEKVDGKLAHVSYTSEDDGVTWTRGGTVAYHDYKDYGTMMQTIENDKFTQMSNGRIFLSQNYQGTIPAGEPNDNLIVFSELYYSDDEGMSWIKCEQSSFDCTDIAHFGESKVIETADGALIWMTPWNTAGYIMAAESKDGGETWGRFYNMLEFPNSTSSFGIMRDPYADNNTTYYMSFVYGESTSVTMPRSRLCIAKTTDGRNWTFLGDVYRFENNLRGSSGSSSTALINHIVDPFLTVTEDYIFVGSGFSMRRNYQNNGFHNNQQQYIYRIEKSALTAYDEFPAY